MSPTRGRWSSPPLCQLEWRSSTSGSAGPVAGQPHSAPALRPPGLSTKQGPQPQAVPHSRGDREWPNPAELHRLACVTRGAETQARMMLLRSLTCSPRQPPQQRQSGGSGQARAGSQQWGQLRPPAVPEVQRPACGWGSHFCLRPPKP